MQFYWILALVFALIVAIFAIQNASLVDIRFLNWEFADISLVLVILGSAVIGAVIIFILGSFKQIGLIWKLKEAEGRIKKLESELQQLKAAEPDEEQPGSINETNSSAPPFPGADGL
ncbi:MAG: LapA family protein [Clostridia bacterium]|nr:LapA family protein [Clostridia bacterium]